MYHDVIRWWMKNSKFDIYVVDSSNNVFDDDIMEGCTTCHFDQSEFTKVTGCSTTLEILSINKAFSMFECEWNEKYDYIIKLTTKYTLPGLENTINKYITNTENEIIFQSRIYNKCQNTELVIYRLDNFMKINEECSKLSGCLESRIYICTINMKSIRLPKLENKSKYKRGAGDFLPHL
jgi:hypothetical protein